MKHLSLVAALLVAAPLAARADDKAKLSDSDLQVVAELHHANQSEVEMANYALAHGTKTVKPYATTLVKDHGSNDKDLAALAKRHGVATMPTPSAMDMDDMAKLKSVSGPALDRMYIDMMVADHEKDIKKVSDAIGTVANADLRNHLSSTKPVLERHLDTAKNLQKSAAQASK